GIAGVAALFGIVGFAGLRAAKLAKDRYAKLVAAGITGLILSQAALNFFAVMGMAPLTGVPLPFVSYGSSNLIVLLAGMGLLLNVALHGGQAAGSAGRRGDLRAIEGGNAGTRRDSGRRDSRARRAGARNRGRA